MTLGHLQKTVCGSTLRIEDAGRVEDPTSIVRPCKSPIGGRSLVQAVSSESAPTGNFHFRRVKPAYSRSTPDQSVLSSLCTLAQKSAPCDALADNRGDEVPLTRHIFIR